MPDFDLDCCQAVQKATEAERILYTTRDPEVIVFGRPAPAMSSLLYRVCDDDLDKFEEATRIVMLFVQAALDSKSEQKP